MMLSDTKKLTDAFQVCLPLLAQAGKKDDVARLCLELDQATRTAGTVLVCGEFKRGKSTFVNALIGRDLCATDVDICTSVVSIIKYGPKEKVIRAYGNLKDIKTQEITIDELEKYTTGPSAQNADTVFIEISLPLDVLKNGLIVIDTPGVGGLDPRHAALTNMFLKKIDIALFVTDVLEPLTSTELGFFRDNVLTNSLCSVVIVNKADLKEKDEVEEIVEDTRNKIRKYIGDKCTETEIITVSAAAEAYPDYDLGESGFDKVRTVLADLTEKRRDLLFDIFAERLTEIINDTKASFQTQLDALTSVDGEEMSALEKLKADTDQRLIAISDPNSEFRKEIDALIAAEREQCVSKLNRLSVELQGEILTGLLEQPEARQSNGGIWLGRQLNKQLNRISSEITDDINATFSRISMMPEFEGMLVYEAEAVTNPIVERCVDMDIPLHKRLMPLTSGLGIYALGSYVLVSMIPVVGGIIAAGGAAYVAYKNSDESAKAIKGGKLREVYGPQISVALSDMRTYLDSRFREFKVKWIEIISDRIKSLRNTLQQTILQINKLKEDMKNGEQARKVLTAKLEAIDSALAQLKKIKEG